MSNNWFDLMSEEEQTETSRILRMNVAEWKNEGQHILKTWTGDLRQCLEYLNDMDKLRAEVTVSATKQEDRTEFQSNFALWRDMLEEPEKYGDDITDWLHLNDTLMSGPGRWRVDAFYTLHEMREQVARRNQAATVIQAAVRGHQSRNHLPIRDCCMCLAHRICPFQTDVGRMCVECGNDGPYTEITGAVGDPWNWFRSKCSWCLAPLDEGQVNYCDGDCKISYIKESWRETY
jgi:hypothetical protein